MPTILSGWYPPNPEVPAIDCQCHNEDFSAIAPVIAQALHIQWSETEAATASTTAIHAAAATATSVQTVTTGITQPSCPRNLVVTFGGTAADLAAVATTVYGTDFDGNEISEEFLATLNTGSTVTGSKAFATVTYYTNGAHDGTGATIAIGVGDKLGLPLKFARNTLLFAFLANAKEGTAATVTVSATALESNTMDLNSALNGTVVDAYFLHDAV
jgi:hypothetical protein